MKVQVYHTLNTVVLFYFSRTEHTFKGVQVQKLVLKLEQECNNELK